MTAHRGGSAIDILGVKVRAFRDREELLAIIRQRIEQKLPLKLAFANANLIYCSHKRPEVREALSDFLVVNDGLGVNIASWLLTRRTFPANLNGTDFTPYMLRGLPPQKIFMFGSTEDVVVRAAGVIADSYPQHAIVGTEHGFISEENARTLAYKIADTKADILLVALGNPRQELWLSNYFPATGCTTAAAVGAYFDFVSGTVRRAPTSVRKLNLEWMFRLILEPKRLLRRYSLEAVSFLLLVMKQRRGQAVQQRRRSKPL